MNFPVPYSYKTMPSSLTLCFVSSGRQVHPVLHVRTRLGSRSQREIQKSYRFTYIEDVCKHLLIITG